MEFYHTITFSEGPDITGALPTGTQADVIYQNDDARAAMTLNAFTITPNWATTDWIASAFQTTDTSTAFIDTSLFWPIG